MRRRARELRRVVLHLRSLAFGDFARRAGAVTSCSSIYSPRVSVDRLQPDDVDWIVDRLDDRRERLVAYAPAYWRPAPDAKLRHRIFIEYLLAEAGAVGLRCNDGLLLSQPRGSGWLVDDAVVAEDKWEADGAELWAALVDSVSGPMRWVCPASEPQRRAFVTARGFDLAESWWHREVDVPVTAVDVAEQVNVVGASARLVQAPPVYAPGGPILFLTAVSRRHVALGSAVTQAPRLGSPVIVVSQSPGDSELATELTAAGFTHHCDFLEGVV